ncbi:hypothetical protein [Ornithinimicrobium pratense]|uniref:NnrS family protein n=1 Tax=Ornithinimicrobium pratense TaxID=2593973 RepID=A0A5J6V7N9_9MICO|nr:hypothetical protein [Ornithinimicrobium pratense]QFG69869.1 hypothetical protein FY030_15190 [Ornithinimicrobium pratense]
MRRGPAPLLLLPGGLALLVGMDAGLTRAGVPAPLASTRLAELHGPLMVLGFLGTVISLERATALRAGWAYLAPALTGAGALALTLLPDPLLGRLLITQGLLTLVLVYAVLWRRNRDLTVAVQALGAVLAAAAALLLTRVEVTVVVPLLIGFVVLTIAAERVELARLAMPVGADRWLVLLAGGVTLAVLGTTVLAGSGVGAEVTWRLLGLALLLLTGWLLRHDVARRTVHATGLPRFAAVALLLGYGWLLVAALGLLLAGRPTGNGYDVIVHATFLGFALSMVLAHAPVILPAVLKVRLPYHRAMWLPLLLLHTTLAARVAALGLVGIGLKALPVWQLALVGNVAALLLFLLTAVVTGLRAGRRPIPARTEIHA